LKESYCRVFLGVLLHEHLMLRPQTVLSWPAKWATSASDNRSWALAEWFHWREPGKSRQVPGFAHTIAVMQTEEALERAYEQPRI
jgi:hypothetical protein